MSIVHHEVKFFLNKRTGEWKGQCICGWWWVGTQEVVQTRAADHDLEWQPVDPVSERAAATS